jgi:peptidoglycan/LPS O-acetylase OafA/YrhL
MMSAASSTTTAESRHPDAYQQHIHVFRGVAILLIVCAHTLPSLDWSANPKLGRFLDALANQSSIYFFFIAGYLFQHLSTRFSFKRYLQQKFKTVIVPYLLLSIPALIVFTLLTQRFGMWSWFYELAIWQQVGLFLLTGKHLAPSWFVPTIALFYLAAPLFLWVDRRAPHLYWAIVPLLILSAHVGRGGQLGPLNFAGYLLPVYLLGMVFSHYKEQALALVQRWWPGLAAVAAVSIWAWMLEAKGPTHVQVPQKVALALLITWLLSRYHGVFGSRLDYIAEVSFGIFFIHAYFISAIKVATVYLVSGRIYKGDTSDDISGNLLTFGLYAMAVLGLSLLVLWLAKRVLGSRSRMFVGA